MTENQTVKERLKIFIKYLDIGQGKFEKTCGFSNGNINNSKGNFGASKIEDILKKYPELNRVWLMTGEGEMLKSNVSIENGDGNNNNTPSTLDKALDALAKSQEQIDRLIVVIEKLTDK